MGQLNLQGKLRFTAVLNKKLFLFNEEIEVFYDFVKQFYFSYWLRKKNKFLFDVER